MAPDAKNSGFETLEKGGKTADILKESEERFRKLFEANPDAISISTMEDGRYVDVNEGFCEISGYQKDEAIGKTSSELGIWASYDDRKTLIDSLQATGRAHLEVRFRRKNGQLITAMLSGRLMTMGGRTYLMTVSRPIDDLKKAQSDLEDSNRRYRDIFQMIPVGIIEMDFSRLYAALYEIKNRVPDVRRYLTQNPLELRRLIGLVRLLDVNEGAIELTEADSKEQLLERHLDLYLDTTFDDLLSWLPGVLAGDQVFETQTQLMTFKKNRLTCLWRLRLPGVQSQLGRVILSCTDITGIRATEDFMRSSLNEKEILLREIHHRVKNNLQVITCMLMLQSNYSKEEKVVEVFKEMANRIRTLALVHEKLCESTDFTALDMRDYVARLSDDIFELFGAQERGIRLDKDIEDISIAMDQAVPLGYIITEILTNAIQHAFSGTTEGRVGIRLKRLSATTIELLIKDNGVGFPPSVDADQPKSFGFDLVQTFTEQINGTLELSNKDGAEVRLVFPMKP